MHFIFLRLFSKTPQHRQIQSKSNGPINLDLGCFGSLAGVVDSGQLRRAIHRGPQEFKKHRS